MDGTDTIRGNESCHYGILVMLEQTWLYQEIHEQPDVLAGLLARERANIERIGREL